jgi:metal-sulfur cluster biosynthetic enzyme
MTETPRAGSAAGPTRELVLDALAHVLDPELCLDIVSLGLVQDVRVDGRVVDIDMTLTTPGCPVSEQLPGEAQAAVQSVLGDAAVQVNLVWDPPWTPERLSPTALRQLGYVREQQVRRPRRRSSAR